MDPDDAYGERLSHKYLPPSTSYAIETGSLRRPNRFSAYGDSHGPAFAIGWIAGLAIAGTITLVIAGGNATQTSGGPATWASVLKLVLGVLFLLLAVRAFRSRPNARLELAMPKWMHAIDTFTAGKALGLAALLSGGQPSATWSMRLFSVPLARW